MAEAKPFTAAKLVCGIISAPEEFFREGERHLRELYGPPDHRSPLFPFELTDYYERQMGKSLKRMFLSFERLIPPENLSAVKLRTNTLEEEMRIGLRQSFRAVNLDPGILTRSALIMATVKDFSHRVPLQNGVYAHLEILFRKDDVKLLDWTYPDFRSGEYQKFFLEVRKLYLAQISRLTPG